MKDKEKQLVNEIKQDFKMHEEKHKQIEEIAKDIHIVCTACSGEMFDEYTCDRCQAKLLIKKGYRKIPEDSVVLSREEYIDLSRNYVGEQVEQARKETAEKILKAFEYCNDTTFYAKWLELCKQFGLEIKE